MDYPLPNYLVEKAVREALAEDLGLAGDITTDLIIPADARGTAAIVVREPARIAGLDLAEAAFRALDPGVTFERLVDNAATAEAGATIARVEGQTRALLTGERTALNFFGLLCGIATQTAAFVAKVEGTKARIADTRKTTPGLRGLEKYAVRCGGGVNHRFGLYDAVLVKDNHIAAAGGLGAALERLQAHAGHTVKIGTQRFALHLVPTGILAPQARCIVGNGMVVDLPRFFEEVDDLIKSCLLYTSDAADDN